MKNTAAHFLECSLLHAARTGRRPASAAVGHRPRVIVSFGMGFEPTTGLQKLRRITLRLLDTASSLRPSRRLADLHDDEFRLHRHRLLILGRMDSMATWCMRRCRRRHILRRCPGFPLLKSTYIFNRLCFRIVRILKLNKLLISTKGYRNGKAARAGPR